MMILSDGTSGNSCEREILTERQTSSVIAQFKKNVYIVRYRHGLAGKAMVVASDVDEAKREAVAYARFAVMCIPEDFGVDDVVESVEPAGEIPLGAAGYGYRPTVQTSPTTV